MARKCRIRSPQQNDEEDAQGSSIYGGPGGRCACTKSERQATWTSKASYSHLLTKVQAFGVLGLLFLKISQENTGRTRIMRIAGVPTLLRRRSVLRKIYHHWCSWFRLTLPAIATTALAKAPSASLNRQDADRHR